MLKHNQNSDLKTFEDKPKENPVLTLCTLSQKQNVSEMHAAEAKRSQKSLVLAIATNPARNDSRVLKEAKSLLAAGYDVIIYAAATKDLPDEEIWEGIKLRRFSLYDIDVPASTSMISQALSLFGPEKNLIKKKFDYVLHLKKLADEADRAYREAKRFPKPLHQLLRLLSSGRQRRNSSFITRTKATRKQALQVYRQAYADEFVYIKHFLFTLNCMSFGLKEIPDIIHSHDLYPLAVSTMFAKICGAKVIYDAHELEVERMPVMTVEQKRFTASIEDHLISRCDAIMTVCDSIANVYRERTGRTPTVIFNSPDTRVARKVSGGLRTATGLGDNVPLIAYSGGVGKEGRGLHLVLEAMLRLPDFHLAILGPRHIKNDDWLLSHAKRIGVCNRVHLLPPVAPDQVIYITQDADIGICPIQDASLSYRFSMPNKLFEMALAGLPIAASDLPEMSRLVKSYNIGMIMDQTRPESIANTMKCVYINREMLRLKDKNLKNFVESYSWQAQEKKLIGLYASVAA